MWASAIVKVQIAADTSASLGHCLVGVEIDLFVFDRPPEPLDEDVVAPCALAIHRDGNLSLLQHGCEVDVCRKHGISNATFYKYKAKYGGMDVSDAHKLMALEDENAKLKKLGWDG
jgi:hypothetical protein